MGIKTFTKMQKKSLYPCMNKVNDNSLKIVERGDFKSEHDNYIVVLPEMNIKAQYSQNGIGWLPP